jgi:DNA-binding transcriptional MerR regulator
VEPNGPSELFGGKQLIQLLGMTYRQLDYWATRLLNRETGSGRHRTFDMDEVMTLASITALVDLGIKPGLALEHLSKSSREIRSVGGHCIITLDLDALRQDVEHALTARCTLVEAAQARMLGEPDASSEE